MTMRISTTTLYEKGTTRMGELQTSLAKTQQQVSTGRRLLVASDDPIASARALEVANSQAVNSTYATNRNAAKDTLSMAEGALQGVTSLLQDVKTLVVQAGGVLDDSQRAFLATELQGRYDELLGLANTRDGVGNYIFAGYQSATKPFAASLTGASYSGDQGAQQMQVNTARYLDVTTNGFDLFQDIQSSGVSTTAATVGNGGTGTISPASVVNYDALTGHDYNIKFLAGGATFDVIDVTTSSTVLSNVTYSSGTPVTFDGMEVNISNAGPAPQAGDTFTVTPVKTQSVFSTLKNLIGALQTPAAVTTGKTKLTGNLDVANANLDSALDHVLTVRASIGANLKEIEALDSLGDDVNVQYAQTLSSLQDLDYVQAITDLTKQQAALQAAQQSFMKVTSLSLFNYLN